jgi:hypothetical protein
MEQSKILLCYKKAEKSVAEFCYAIKKQNFFSAALKRSRVLLHFFSAFL